MMHLLLFSLSFIEGNSVLAANQRTWDDAYALASSQVSSLSLQDKVALGSGIGWAKGPCVGNTAPVNSIKNFNGLCMQDSPTGVRFVNNVSAYPASINLASTFDRKLMVDHGASMAAEFKELGVNLMLGPMMNGLRAAPDAGRNWEGSGADPYLTAECAKLQVRGIQSQGVIATAKHFLLNEQETFRTNSSSNVDDRTLHEIYLKPFKACVEEGVGAIMCSYNLVDQIPACENDYLLNHILKKELGFKGLVMTDWWATHDTVASALASEMIMPGDKEDSGPQVWGQNLINAVYKNLVPISRIDDIATRILATWYKLGQDTNYPPVQFDSFLTKRVQSSSSSIRKKPVVAIDIRADHHKHIRTVGSASTVLLKNTANVLPLKNNIKVAILGSDAGPGDSTSNSHNCDDHGCSSGTIAQGWGSGTANFPYIVTPLEGIQNRAGKAGVSISYSLNDYDMEAAYNLAASADVTLVFVSADSGEQYITVNGNAGDRTASGLNLWNNGDNIIYQAASASRNVVVVIHAPGPVNMPWINHPSIVGIVYAGFPGQESGNSLADVLFGDVNPSGRLPFSINSKIEDYSARVMTDYTFTNGLKAPQVNFAEGLFIDYRFNDAYKINPLFEFGFGLSYTNFVYENFALDTSSLDRVIVIFNVKNVGAVRGEEVAQLYLGFPESADEPPKLLKDFDKQMIECGQSMQFKLTVPSSEMQIWDSSAQAWISPRGTYQIYIGTSSRNIKWRGSFFR